MANQKLKKIVLQKAVAHLITVPAATQTIRRRITYMAAAITLLVIKKKEEAKNQKNNKRSGSKDSDRSTSPNRARNHRK